MGEKIQICSCKLRTSWASGLSFLQGIIIKYNINNCSISMGLINDSKP